MTKQARNTSVAVMESETALEMLKRPPKPADFTPEFIYWAASHFVSQEVIGELFGISQPAVSKRLAREPFKSAFASGRAAAKMNLHAAQYRNAVVKDNMVGQIWLGKQYLNQKDAVHEIKQDTNVEVRFLAEWGGPAELAPPEADDIIEGEVEDDEG